MDFINLGKAAHANGEHRAPALNAHVQEAIAGLQVGDPKALRVMSEFTKGYDMAIRDELDAAPSSTDQEPTAPNHPGTESTK
jgi:hypothetical protein